MSSIGENIKTVALLFHTLHNQTGLKFFENQLNVWNHWISMLLPEKQAEFGLDSTMPYPHKEPYDHSILEERDRQTPLAQP